MILESLGNPQTARINDSGIAGVDCGGLYGGNDWISGWREPGHWDLQKYGCPVVVQLHLYGVEGGEFAMSSALLMQLARLNCTDY